MAKISAHGAHTVMQITASKPDTSGLTKDGKVHMTLTVTSDCRLLQKTTHRWKSGGTGGGGYKVIGKLKPEDLARPDLKKALGHVAKRYGYTADA